MKKTKKRTVSTKRVRKRPHLWSVGNKEYAREKVCGNCGVCVDATLLRNLTECGGGFD